MTKAERYVAYAAAALTGILAKGGRYDSPLSSRVSPSAAKEAHSVANEMMNGEPEWLSGAASQEDGD